MEPEFAWQDFFVLAEELAVRAEPAARRSAVSRAYYAAFHLARQHQERARRICFDRHDKHNAVWHEYRRPGARTIEVKIARVGVRLREWRNEADYDAHFTRPSEDAVALARQMLRDLVEVAGRRSHDA